MIVDVVGLPGAGKSTLATSVVSLLRREGVEAVAGQNDGSTAADGRRLTRPERFVAHVAAVCGNPRLVAVCASIAVRPGGSEYVSAFVNLCRRDRALRAARPAGLLLLHESSLHRLFIALALMGRSSRDDVERFVRRMAWPDALVYLEVAPEVATERVRKRLEGMGPVAAADIAALDAGAGWRHGYREATENALDVIGSTRPILRLDGTSKDVSQLADDVRAWLEAARSADTHLTACAGAGGRRRA